MEDSNGYPVQYGNDPNRHVIRLDSVNGLLNLDKQLGRPIRKVQTYNSIISELRRAIFNIKDKKYLNFNVLKVKFSYLCL